MSSAVVTFARAQRNRPRPDHADTPPPAWYPDPSGRHDERFWDGTSWTSHVRSGPQLQAMRVSAGALDAQRVLYDRDVPLGPLAHKRLRLQVDRFCWGRTEIALHDVHAVAHWAEVDRPGAHPGWDRLTYLLWGRHRPLRIVLSAPRIDRKARSGQEEAFTAAVNLARQVIEPRLAMETIGRLERDVEVRIGKLRLTKRGIVMSRLLSGRRATASMRWGELIEIGGDDVTELARTDTGMVIPRQDPSERNVVLLPLLLRSARDNFA
jgi:hypothetical protein